MFLRTRFLTGLVTEEDLEKCRKWIDEAYQKSYPGIFRHDSTRTLSKRNDDTVTDHLKEAISAERLYIAEVDGEVVACCSVHVTHDAQKSDAYLTLMAVNPAFQRFHVGDIMFLGLLLDLGAQNINTCTLELVSPADDTSEQATEQQLVKDDVRKCHEHAKHIRKRYIQHGFKQKGETLMMRDASVLQETLAMKMKVFLFECEVPRPLTAMWWERVLQLVGLQIYFSAHRHAH